jgi:putative copper resistance protein D
MDDGARGVLHLSADILHLVAAAAWVGALAMFVLLAARARPDSPDRIKLLGSALHGFATMGVLIVATLVITGAINHWLISGLAFGALISTPYGVLLMCKLLGFALMLGMAATNRYLLGPGLEMALRNGDASRAMTALRRSLTIEFAAASVVLFLVAWLGTLSP